MTARHRKGRPLFGSLWRWSATGETRYTKLRFKNVRESPIFSQLRICVSSFFSLAVRSLYPQVETCCIRWLVTRTLPTFWLRAVSSISWVSKHRKTIVISSCIEIQEVYHMRTWFIPSPLPEISAKVQCWQSAELPSKFWDTRWGGLRANLQRNHIRHDGHGARHGDLQKRTTRILVLNSFAEEDKWVVSVLSR